MRNIDATKTHPYEWRTMRLFFLTALSTAFACAAPSRAANLAAYPFNNTLAPTTVQDVTATGFGAAGSRAVVGSGSNDNGSYGFILITQSSTSISDSVGNKQYAQFTVSPPEGNGMQIEQIQCIASRGGDSSPRGIALRWSVDNYQSNLGSADVTSTWPKTRTYTFNVNSFAGASVTFRIYAFAHEISQAEPSIRFSKLVVTGFPIFYAAAVLPQATRSTTAKDRYVIKGTAHDPSGVSRVEVAKRSAHAAYTGASGTTTWKFVATPLKTGNNIFYVRSIDASGAPSAPVKVTIRRTRAAP
ncbi:MAG: hypothetical protein PHC88_16575 [Terrimicrobiaceae bacterium]|nr:hypothetical protein [Terrimicrobiaceae bacterium]